MFSTSPDTLILRLPNRLTMRSRASRVLRSRNTGFRFPMVGTGRNIALYSSSDARRCLPLIRCTTCGCSSAFSCTASPVCSFMFSSVPACASSCSCAGVSAGAGSGFCSSTFGSIPKKIFNSSSIVWLFTFFLMLFQIKCLTIVVVVRTFDRLSTANKMDIIRAVKHLGYLWQQYVVLHFSCIIGGG